MRVFALSLLVIAACSGDGGGCRCRRAREEKEKQKTAAEELLDDAGLERAAAGCLTKQEAAAALHLPAGKGRFYVVEPIDCRDEMEVKVFVFCEDGQMYLQPAPSENGCGFYRSMTPYLDICVVGDLLKPEEGYYLIGSYTETMDIGFVGFVSDGDIVQAAVWSLNTGDSQVWPGYEADSLEVSVEGIGRTGTVSQEVESCY